MSPHDLKRLLGEAATKSTRAKVVETLDRLLGGAGQLTEGTVIVLNSDDPNQEHALKQALGQLAKPAGSQPAQPTQTTIPTHERFQLETGGKTWKFKVNRDVNGVITDLDVVEPAA